MVLDKRQQIINTAIKLFNEKGYSNVSIRDISNEINISPGNLTYYFKQKSDIIKSIYQQIYNEFSDVLRFELLNFQELDVKFENIYRLQQKYFFIFSNVVVLSQNHPELCQYNRVLSIDFEKSFNFLINYYVSEGLMKPEPIEGIYNNLNKTFNALFPLVIASNIIHLREIFDDITVIKDILWSLLVPYFTEKGLNMYNTLKAKQF